VISFSGCRTSRCHPRTVTSASACTSSDASSAMARETAARFNAGNDATAVWSANCNVPKPSGGGLSLGAAS
jgi:hypothetical protein